VETNVRQITAPDGRALEVVMAGPEDGDVVLLHVGTPSAGELFEPHVHSGAERGLRHISYSRPGYGDSDRHEGRTVADCAADVEAIADALGIESLYVIGWSGGGPHSLACAALLGDRVLAAATLCGVAPRDAEGLDWAAGMGPENVREFEAAEAGPEELRAYLEGVEGQLAHVTGPHVADALGKVVSPVDRETLTGEYGEYAAAGFRGAMRQGIWGWLDDDVAFVRKPWGFDLGAISTPVTIWQGGQDRFVPFAHGEWLSAHVSGASARLYPEHGHLSIKIAHYGDALDDLRARGQARSR
jgi:pimeloyl-ACP methyl ester carboxylesterase